ncbi:hypothetical protein VYU27_007876 [Nannochloropsis oceanica]
MFTSGLLPSKGVTGGNGGGGTGAGPLLASHGQGKAPISSSPSSSFFKGVGSNSMSSAFSTSNHDREGGGGGASMEGQGEGNPHIGVLIMKSRKVGAEEEPIPPSLLVRFSTLLSLFTVLTGLASLGLHLLLLLSPATRAMMTGYHPLTPHDRQLASLTCEELGGHSSLPPSLALPPFLPPSLPFTRLHELTQQKTVFLGLARLSVMVICFKSPALMLRCRGCRKPSQWCDGRRCQAPSLEPYWEVQCVVDDGTGQANVLADGELAVQLLRVEPVRRQRLERELRKRVAMASRGIGGGGGGGGMGRETIGEWLWAELFRDPSERGRRLRRLDILVHEILLKHGKGQSSSSSSSSPSSVLPSRPPYFDIKTRGGRGQERPTWSLHMPALKAIYVQDMDARAEAYALVRGTTMPPSLL